MNRILDDLAWLYSLYEARRLLKKKREQIIALRESRFRRILLHAYQHSTFYQKYYSEHGIKESHLKEIPINELPPVTKQQIQGNWDDVVTSSDLRKADIEKFVLENHDPRSLYKGCYHIVHTSGTSGAQAIYCYGPDDWRRAMSRQIRLWTDSRLRRRVAVLGVCKTHAVGVGMAVTSMSGFKSIFYNTRLFDIGDPWRVTIDGLNEFQPQAMFAYANTWGMLSEEKLAGRLNIEPQFMYSGAEPLLPMDENAVKKAFSGSLINYYASAECLSMAWGETSLGGLYVNDDTVYLEPATNGIYVTNLCNFTLPLIRYFINDGLTLRSDNPLNLPLTFISPVSGKQFENLVLPNNRGEMEAVSAHLFVEMWVPGIKLYQYHFNPPEELEVKVVLEPGTELNIIHKAVEDYWHKIFKVKEISPLRIKVTPVEEILPNPDTGKMQLVVTTN